MTQYANNTGGMPEIWRASADLRVALDQTRQEIESAAFDPERFSATPISHDRQKDEGLTGVSPTLRDALAEEGQSGAKRHSLLVELARINGILANLIPRVVMLRTDLIDSQKPYVVLEAVGEPE